MTEQELQEASRAAQARQGYINWRMADLPVVYQTLMPYSYDTKSLWKAEQAIRRQYDEDQKLALSPWRRIGPACALLDHRNMTAQELLDFGCEISVPVGMEDQPKRGSSMHRKAEKDAYHRYRQQSLDRRVAEFPDVRQEVEKLKAAGTPEARQELEAMIDEFVSLNMLDPMEKRENKELVATHAPELMNHKPRNPRKHSPGNRDAK